MISHTQTIHGTFHLADDETDDGSFYRQNYHLWSSLPASVVERTYVHHGVRVQIRANWESARHIAAEGNRVLQKSIAASSEGSFTWVESIPHELTVPVEVLICGENSHSMHAWYPRVFVDNYLYDIFTILNVSLPGSADFMNLSVLNENQHSLPEPTQLSPYYLHRAYSDGEWPILSPVSTSAIAEWYSNVRNSISQIPRNSLERAIFAMWHICRSHGRPEDVVLIFHALEALLQTKVGENFAALVDRLTLILEPDEKQASVMKQKLRAMYNHRSSFVHGGLPIIHPMHHELLDGMVDEVYSSTIELSIYGIKLLIACFQKYARNGWTIVNFKTSMQIG